ncbi:MAG: hypothetical protein AABZ61_00525, partial [Bacteroidota bacterium]
VSFICLALDDVNVVLHKLKNLPRGRFSQRGRSRLKASGQAGLPVPIISGRDDLPARPMAGWLRDRQMAILGKAGGHYFSA